ncbi:MAG: hypothetical protein M1828_005188 [Chrysothrix sp. TS-e1954]|nr:MAG: hypothetical protein M1828_005188 [Chrysothrix sp. TS-e1954]
MAFKELCAIRPLMSVSSRRMRPSFALRLPQCQRHASSVTAVSDLNDLEPAGSSESLTSAESAFDPIVQSRGRKRQLPSSRYKFRSPRFYRGPLHPHQPLKPSEPNSREFIPGPFTHPRYAQTYHDTIAPDLMTLAYQHYPPGFAAPPTAPTLRDWDDTSPYHKNRPPRPPRGSVMRLVQRPVTFRNIPELTGITVHSQLKMNDNFHLHVAGMVVQTITGVRYEPHVAKKDILSFNQRKGHVVSVVSSMKGEDMWHFLAKLVDVVMPRFREWPGVKGSSGDNQGNISFGIGPEQMIFFPEIEVNYDAYPPKMIPGCHITLKTSARSDKHARLLLSALGVPFYGKMVNY